MAQRGGGIVVSLTREFWVLRGGYQLCHSCGEVLVNGDRCWRQEAIDGFHYWHVRKQLCAYRNRN